jgi:hypothetical protein
MSLRRTLGAISIAIGAVLSVGLILLNFNPFALAFQTSITIHNNSGKDLLVSPIGIREGAGDLYPLPRFVWSAPVLPAVRQARLQLPSGGAVSIKYDWDDIIFSSVVVESEGTAAREMIVEPSARVENCCYVPRNTTPTIPSLDALALARPEAIDSVKRHTWNPRGLILYLPLLGPVILTCGILLIWQRNHAKARNTKLDA